MPYGKFILVTKLLQNRITCRRDRQYDQADEICKKQQEF